MISSVSQPHVRCVRAMAARMSNDSLLLGLEQPVDRRAGGCDPLGDTGDAGAIKHGREVLLLLEAVGLELAVRGPDDDAALERPGRGLADDAARARRDRRRRAATSRT